MLCLFQAKDRLQEQQSIACHFAAINPLIDNEKSILAMVKACKGMALQVQGTNLQ